MSINASIRYVANIFLFLFLLLSLCLVYWQVVAAPALTANVHNQRHCLLQNAPLRGRILDRNGVVLAQSIPDKTALCGYIRHYSEPSLAGLIGYYVPEYGLVDGIEKQYSDILDGVENRIPLDDLINQTLHSRFIGNDIYLTIDVRIQRLVNQYFTHYHPATDELYQRPSFRGMAYESTRGAVIVSNPQTGEILAMVSAPGYDPNRMVQTLAHGDLSYFNQVNQNKDQPLLMRPLKARYAPGSIFKTLTLLAALDMGVTTLDSPWSKQEALGPVVYEGRSILGNNLGYGMYTFHFPITTTYAYANSDNLVFAQLGVRVGSEKWLEYAQRFYIDQNLPFDLPLVRSSVENRDHRPLSTLQLASNAFGQGIDDITPFQMTLIDNAIANNGVLMRPILVAKILDKDGNPVQVSSPEVLSIVVGKDIAYQIRQAMNGVTTCGSAWRLNKTFGYTDGIIGKTGTAEVGGGLKPHAWMLTQAPFWLDNPDQMPVVSIVAMRENAGEGAYAVGPAIWQMYQEIFRKGYIKATLPPANNPYLYCPEQGLWQLHS
ncbi:penicillin-binding transpeptidase domain-containing protein [Dictyobacter kobayashii]|uniref:Penicillin-binding protein n=1 Tax=Dictyobacter kobayashii TaxID=2014872 RepID=A0A402AJV2_9CHLR|nr:penicillin-binding transpeptidase domain-containing protein [Dictyobacter kobayashii]GCE19376.1 penicillin-binding protein [Dictyobacter kobayashii]